MCSIAFIARAAELLAERWSLITTFAGPVDEGRDALAPMQELPTPAFDTLAPKPYVTHQKMFDPFHPHGWHQYWRSHKLVPLTDEIIDVVVDKAAQLTSPLSAVPIFSLGGAVARVREESTAFPYRDASYDINIVASWLPAEAGDAGRHIEWVRGSRP